MSIFLTFFSVVFVFFISGCSMTTEPVYTGTIKTNKCSCNQNKVKTKTYTQIRTVPFSSD